MVSLTKGFDIGRWAATRLFHAVVIVPVNGSREPLQIRLYSRESDGELETGCTRGPKPTPGVALGGPEANSAN